MPVNWVTRGPRRIGRERKSAMYFDDRIDAARQLVHALREGEIPHPLILAIPRGAVPMARLVAECLGGDLDVAIDHRLYTPHRAPLDVAGRGCIVVDDGASTGATLAAALRALRARHPGRLVCALPVASREALARIDGLADRVVCLESPIGFQSLRQCYRDFAPVSDAEVVAHLEAADAAREMATA